MGGISVKIDVLTLFPNMFTGFLNESIMGRAIKNQLVEVNLIDFREFSNNKHKKVDDYPFGGGAGMVLQVQPIYDALLSIPGYKEALKILVSPQGETFSQRKAYELSNQDHIIILCGHYEGYDERIRSYFDLEISIGDYVLTGGELAAAIVTDSIVRLIPGVISDETSALTDSFQDNLLAPPVYTRPADYNGWIVPDVLLSGNFKEIEKWQMEQSIERTKRLRPDLLDEIKD